MKKILFFLFFIVASSIYSGDQLAIREETQPAGAALQEAPQPENNQPSQKKQKRFSSDNRTNLSKFEEESNMERENQFAQYKKEDPADSNNILFDITTTHGKAFIESKTKESKYIKDIYQLRVPDETQASGQPPVGGMPGQQPPGAQYGNQR